MIFLFDEVETFYPDLSLQGVHLPKALNDMDNRA